MINSRSVPSVQRALIVLTGAVVGFLIILGLQWGSSRTHSDRSGGLTNVSFEPDRLCTQSPGTKPHCIGAGCCGPRGIDPALARLGTDDAGHGDAGRASPEYRENQSKSAHPERARLRLDAGTHRRDDRRNQRRISRSAERGAFPGQRPKSIQHRARLLYVPTPNPGSIIPVTWDLLSRHSPPWHLRSCC